MKHFLLGILGCFCALGIATPHLLNLPLAFLRLKKQSSHLAGLNLLCTSVLLTISPHWDLLFSRDSPYSGFWGETDCEMEICIQVMLKSGLGVSSLREGGKTGVGGAGSCKAVSRASAKSQGELRDGPLGCPDWVFVPGHLTVVGVVVF